MERERNYEIDKHFVAPTTKAWYNNVLKDEKWPDIRGFSE